MIPTRASRCLQPTNHIAPHHTLEVCPLYIKKRKKETGYSRVLYTMSCLANARHGYEYVALNTRRVLWAPGTREFPGNRYSRVLAVSPQEAPGMETFHPLSSNLFRRPRNPFQKLRSSDFIEVIFYYHSSRGAPPSPTQGYSVFH